MAFDPAEDLKLALIGVLNHNISLVTSAAKRKIPDFKDQRAEYYRTLVKTNLNKLKEMAKSMDDSAKKQVENLENMFMKGDAKGMLGIVADMSFPKQRTFSTPYVNISMPIEIRDEIYSDLSEVERCFGAEAYRSSMILCARVLETALHRKYYDVTGKDLLETSPGIGLGNVVAKLRESGIEVDPALTQQIHLINNVRIFSVHKKNVPFMPSKEQAQATLLFTVDILKKLF